MDVDYERILKINISISSPFPFKQSETAKKILDAAKRNTVFLKATEQDASLVTENN